MNTPAVPGRVMVWPIGDRTNLELAWGAASNVGTPPSKVSVKLSSLAAADTIRVEPGPDPAREKLQVPAAVPGTVEPAAAAGAPLSDALGACWDTAAVCAGAGDEERVAVCA
jgi:hypothetical protein